MAYEKLGVICKDKGWKLIQDGPVSSGPSHSPIFTCTIRIQAESKILYEITKEASKKKQSEKDAAAGILEQIDPSIHALCENNFNELKQHYSHIIKEDIKYEYVKKGSDHLPEFHAKASIEVENEKIESHGTGPNKSAARKSAEASLVSKLKNEITERSNRSNVKDAKISSKKDNVEKNSCYYYSPPSKEGRVGKGAFGHVFVCVHEKNPSKMLAVKIPIGVSDEEDAEIFKKEMENLKTLSKKDLVINFHGLINFEDRIGLLMDYYPAGTLLQMIKSKKMCPSLIHKIFTSLANAILFLHNFGDRKRFTHNDIKPANILLSNELEPLLCDLGGATCATKTSKRSSRFYSRDGAHDTCFYRGPEISESSELKNHVRSTSHDVHCFGVSLFEAISRGLNRNIEKKEFCRWYRLDQRELFQNYREHLKILEDKKQYDEADLLYNLEKSVHEFCLKDPKQRPTMKKVVERLEEMPNKCQNETTKSCKEELKKTFKEFTYDKTWVKLDDVVQKIRNL